MKRTRLFTLVRPLALLLLLPSGAFGFYCPITGKWLSRDPINEPGFQPPTAERLRSRTPEPSRNDYCLVHNNPVGQVDPVGLIQWTPAMNTHVRVIPFPKERPDITGTLWTVKTDAGNTIPVWKPDDGFTYWCHGYTFGGPTAPGGPYSIGTDWARKVLEDDGWVQVCCAMAGVGNVVTFGESPKEILHSGIIRTVAADAGKFDESRSFVDSKLGWRPGINMASFKNLAGQYGNYKCYRKKPALVGCCLPGEHEDYR